MEAVAPITTLEEFKDALNNRDQRAVDFIEEIRRSEPKQVVFAQNQGRDKAQHFVGFVTYEEKDSEGFSAYFMKDNSHHIFQQEGFLHELESVFPDIQVLETDNPDQKLHIFYGTGVFLKEETQRYDSGEIFAVRYTAYRSEMAQQMGSIAAAHAMQ